MFTARRVNWSPALTGRYNLANTTRTITKIKDGITMTTRNLLCLAVLAVVGLSACSQNPASSKATASVPEADDLPANVELSALSKRESVAKAMDLVYSPQQSHVPAAAEVPHYGFPPAQVQHVSMAPSNFQQSRPVPQSAYQAGSGMPKLSTAELRAIGQQIFVNEGGGNMKRLVHWNVGEDFASMGIGHFTWYPSGRKQSFGNTFPGLLDFMVSKGVQLPGWLQQARHSGAPWRSRSELLSASNSPQVLELQNLLYNTREIQAEYIVNRARRAMPRLVKASSGSMQQRVATNLNAVANTPGGWYALIDYVNFKGEGLGKGGYKGQSWGLRQVLEEMRPSQPGQQALHEFADAAMRVLERRVRNSDPSRGEARWLKGWANRVNTYRNPIV